MTSTDLDLADRIAGGLLGLAAGDALGATLEFATPAAIRRRGRVHDEITGGGPFGWRPGQGTDDTDLAYAVARTYADGYSLDRVAAAFLAWYRTRPRDVGATTRAALAELERSGDPRSCGQAVLHPYAAGNGALMRALATGLARPDPTRRRKEAAEIAAVTHADPRCVAASVAYCDLAAALLDGADPRAAVTHVLATSPITGPVHETIAAVAGTPIGSERLRPTGFVLDTLQVAVWALLQPRPLEALVVEIVNLGGDADTTGAVAGGLLGVRDGTQAVPLRWRARLEYREALEALVPHLVAVHHQGRRAAPARP